MSFLNLMRNKLKPKEVNEALENMTAPPAEDVSYDNTDSGLTATDVQSAIDEVNTKFTGVIRAVEVEATTSSAGDISLNQYATQIPDYSKIVNIVVKTPNAYYVELYSYSSILYARIKGVYDDAVVKDTNVTLRVFIIK